MKLISSTEHGNPLELSTTMHPNQLPMPLLLALRYKILEYIYSHASVQQKHPNLKYNKW
jgi:hypothetical protein